MMLKPERCETKIYAVVVARAKSMEAENKDKPFYVYYNQAGYYLIDESGEIYGGETLIAKYLNGEKV